MLFQIVAFTILLTILFFLSQKIQTHIYNSLFIITKSKKFSIGVLLVLLLPGTIIHELSHFLIATILRVPTGELTVIPTIEKNEVKAGKLFLGATDPFRLSIIGLAPILIGLLLIYFTGKTFILNTDEIMKIFNSPLLLFVICYLLNVVSLTMFSSKKDLQGAIIAGPIIFFLLISLYMIGVRIFLDNSLISKLITFLSDLNYYLLITAVFNFLIYLILSVNLSLWSRFLGTKNRGSSIH